MAVLLRRRHAAAEAVPRTCSSRRPLHENDSLRSDTSLTPKQRSQVGLSTVRFSKELPISGAKRPAQWRVRVKEKATKVSRCAVQDKLNHSFSCSQVYHKGRSKRLLDPDFSPLDPVELTPFSAIKPTSSQRRLTESPEKLNRIQGDFQRSRNILEGVIRTDARAKSLLRVVQSAYEDYIQSLENEVETLTKELKSAQEIAVSNQITIRKLESLVTALQTKVQNLKFELDFRIFEAREKAEETPAEMSSTREEELNTLKKRIRFCTQLLDFMQAKGLPVVETYREMKFQNKSTRDSNRSQLVSLSDLKPPDESQSYKKLEIPKIVLPLQSDKCPDFQDEFFSKIGEFSESWRREATLTQSRMRADAG